MRIVREIKFRAWEEDVEFMNYSVCITTTENKSYYEVSEGFGLIEVNPEHVMQYTGLKDKNGTEIYEGDIVTSELYKAEGVAFECFFDEKECMFKLRPFMFKNNDRKIGNKDLTLQMSSVKDKEVIGNIYENPELLEEKQ